MANDPVASPPPAHPSDSPATKMPVRFFWLATTYLILLIAVFITYRTRRSSAASPRGSA